MRPTALALALLALQAPPHVEPADQCVLPAAPDNAAAWTASPKLQNTAKAPNCSHIGANLTEGDCCAPTCQWGYDVVAVSTCGVVPRCEGSATDASVVCGFTTGGSSAAQCPDGCNFSSSGSFAIDKSGTFIPAANCAPTRCPNFVGVAGGAKPQVGLSEHKWMRTAGFWATAVYAMAVGANNVANSFGPAVASRSMSLTCALWLGVIFEAAGALVMGRHQRNIMHQDIIDISMFASDPDALMLAMVCVSIAGAAWVLGMSAAGLPISAHQATLGGFLGVAAVMTPGAFPWQQ